MAEVKKKDSSIACGSAGSRRGLLKAAFGAAVASLAPGDAGAQADARNARPLTGDRFVRAGGR